MITKQFKRDETTGMQVKGDRIYAGNRCHCGCSIFPYCGIVKGEIGLVVKFESEDELSEFKKLIQSLDFSKVD